MDPLTHSLVGVLAGKSVRASNRRVWIMALLGMLPDIDVIGNWLGGWAYYLQHRGITHSLVGLLCQTLFYSWLFRRLDSGSFKERSLHYSLPLMLHIFGDLLTPYGVPLLAPFSFKSFSLDLVGGLTLIPLLFMVAGLYLKRHHHIWAAWAFYLVLSFAGKTYASRLLNLPIHEVETIPSTLNPFEWRGVQIDSESDSYRTFTINLLEHRLSLDKSYLRPQEDAPIQQSLKSPMVQTFIEENRWPVARYLIDSEGMTVEWGHLLYSMKGVVRGKVRVVLSPEGKVLKEERIFKFWNPV